MIGRRRALALGLAAAVASPARAQTPPRIVSVGSSLTEIVYALGAEQLLVGVDSTSLFPAAARRCRRSATCVRCRPRACWR
jgi:iron complex transport system substrate-binding protein